jgi:hypothetical protein
MVVHLYVLVLVKEPRALEIGLCIFMGFGFGNGASRFGDMVVHLYGFWFW